MPPTVIAALISAGVLALVATFGALWRIILSQRHQIDVLQTPDAAFNRLLGEVEYWHGLVEPMRVQLEAAEARIKRLEDTHDAEIAGKDHTIAKLQTTIADLVMQNTALANELARLRGQP